MTQRFRILIGLGLFLLLVYTSTVAQQDTGSFLQDSLQVITSTNADRITELARLGNGSVDRLAWSPDNQYIVAFGASGAWLFNRSDISEPESHIQNHSERVEYGAFSPDGALIATGSDDAVVVTRVETDEELYTLETASGFAAFSPDGTWLVTDSRHDSGSPIVWSVSTGEMITELERSQLASFIGVAFSQDGSHMAGVYHSGRWGYMNAIKVWDTLTWDEQLLIPTPGKWIHSVSFSGSTALLIACTESEILTWDLREGLPVDTDRENIECPFEQVDRSEIVATFGINSAEVYGGVVSPDQSSIAFIDESGHLQIGDTSTLQRQISTFTFSGYISELAFSPNGQTLAVLEGKPNGATSMRLWDVTSRPITIISTVTLDDYHTSTSHLAILSNDQLLIYDTNSGKVHIWNTVSEEFTTNLDVDIGGRGFLAVSTDLSEITSFNWQFDVAEVPMLRMQTWHIASGTVLSTLAHPGSYEYATPIIWKSTYSPSGDFIATAGRAAHLWDAQTGEEVAVLYDYTFGEGQWEIDDVIFSPDSRLLVADTKEWNSQLYVWDVQRAIETYPMTLQNPMTDTESLVAQLSHVSASLVFSPDGELLVSGSHGPFWSGDSTIRIWNTIDWVSIADLRGHIDGVYSLDFNSEGTLLASAGNDGVIRLWGVVE